MTSSNLPQATEKRPSSESGSYRRLPGDLTLAQATARMLRVNQAGEYGAKRIYEGQLAILRNHPAATIIRHMSEQEQRHLDRFDELLIQRRVRPTILSPLWHVAGFALGAATAALGVKAAMACTEAVEEVIDEHYTNQISRLDETEAPLAKTIEDFRRDEIEHRDVARTEGAQQAPGYPILKAAVKTGSRLAIWLSERF